MDDPVDGVGVVESAASRRWAWAVGAVAALALVARVLPTLRGGGLVSTGGYDDSVYYAAATALVHGRTPYDDFVLLHPPGLILALTPFAALARVTSDTVGQDVARVVFMLLGTLNTVLVMRVGRRFGRWAGVGAGLVYAVSFPALYAERTTTLETLGSTTVLVALTLLVRTSVGGRGAPPLGWTSRTRRTRRTISTARLVGAGLALGAGAGIKIWGVVPLAVIAGWVLLVAGRRAAAVVFAAAATAVAALCLPFFVGAPGQMWRYVVSDQLGRPRGGVSTEQRLIDMAGLTFDFPDPTGVPAGVALGVVLALVALAAVACLRTPGARIFVVLLVAEAILLLASPSFFLHYSTLTAAPGALALGVGAQRMRRWQRGRVPVGPARLAAAATAAAVLAWGIPGIWHPIGRPFPSRLTSAAARTTGCITADDPTYLIEMNVLSRDLDAGCRVWVDVTGLTYDRAGGGAPGQPIQRATDPTWQRKVMSYLLSGSATVVARPETGLDPQSRHRLRGLPVLARDEGFALRWVQ